MSNIRPTKQQKEALNRVVVLTDYVRARLPGPFDAASLSRSYNVPIAHVTSVITKHGGSLG